MSAQKTIFASEIRFSPNRSLVSVAHSISVSVDECHEIHDIDGTQWFQAKTFCELNHHCNCFLLLLETMTNPRWFSCVNYSNRFQFFFSLRGANRWLYIYLCRQRIDRKYSSLKVVHRFSFHSMFAIVKVPESSSADLSPNKIRNKPKLTLYKFSARKMAKVALISRIYYVCRYLFSFH